MVNTRPLEQRFWDKVNKNGSTPINKPVKTNCWEWTGHLQGGYGYTSALIDGKRQSIRAHRLSVELHTGKPIPDRMSVLHKCDNKKCVRPEHLYIGTASDNELDKKRIQIKTLKRFTKSKTSIEAFNKRIEKIKDGCWNWIGSSAFGGYGKFSHNKIYYLAHRFSYQYYIGDIQPDMVIMHLCDNRKCVNPQHLQCGTKKENTQDCYNKGRHPLGKLTEKKVLDIYEAYRAGGLTQKALANKFNLSLGLIHQLFNGKIQKYANLIPLDFKQEITKTNKNQSVIKRSKLSIDDVRAIKKLYASGQHNVHSLSKKFGVWYTSIYNIISGKTWKDIK